jgi:hypothetical protein
MNRTEYEEFTHHMHKAILINQFGHAAFNEEEFKYLTKINVGTQAFGEVMDILERAGIIKENISLSLVEPNEEFHGRCITGTNEDGYTHKIEMNTRTLATLIHEVAHTVCFDEGVYEDYMEELCDETAHGADFDEMMLALINIVLTGKGIRYEN